MLLVECCELGRNLFLREIQVQRQRNKTLYLERKLNALHKISKYNFSLFDTSFTSRNNFSVADGVSESLLST